VTKVSAKIQQLLLTLKVSESELELVFFAKISRAAVFRSGRYKRPLCFLF